MTVQKNYVDVVWVLSDATHAITQESPMLTHSIREALGIVSLSFNWFWIISWTTKICWKFEIAIIKYEMYCSITLFNSIKWISVDVRGIYRMIYFCNWWMFWFSVNTFLCSPVEDTQCCIVCHLLQFMLMWTFIWIGPNSNIIITTPFKALSGVWFRQVIAVKHELMLFTAESH